MAGRTSPATASKSRRMARRGATWWPIQALPPPPTPTLAWRREACATTASRPSTPPARRTASNTANATTGAASAAVPGAPRVLTATANGQTRIDLSWSAPTTNGGANITGYRIEVSTNGSSWSDLVANTGSATTTYSHTGLTAGSTRHYRVSAINSAGPGTPTARRPTPPTPPPTRPSLRSRTPAPAHPTAPWPMLPTTRGWCPTAKRAGC